jgi:heat shock protein HtpX
MRRWPADFGLQIRMALTLLIIGVIYLAFLAFLYWLGIDPLSLMIIAAVMLGIQYFFSDKLVLASTRAKVVSPEQAPELHRIVEELSSEAGIPKPRVAIVPTGVPNAFATGRSLHHSVIAVTQGLLQQLNTDEVKAVLAHELSHVRNRDVAVITLASFLSTIAGFIMQSFMFGGMYGGRDRRGIGTILLLPVAIVVYFVSLLLVRLLSRYRELAADRGSAIITGHPSHLINALLKISGVMQQVPKRDLRADGGATMNQFFIIPQIRGRSILSLFATHPSLEKRIRQLKRMEQTMGP